MKRKTSLSGLRGALILTLELLPVSGWAQSPEPAMGEETRAWVQLQQSNSASITETRPMSGEVADQVYERYVKSFSRPIPAKFERDSFTTGSSQ